MAKGHYVKKVVPKTTTNITKAIVNHLLSNKHSASRVNVQGQYDENIGQYRRSGSRLGFSDIAGVLKTRYSIGLFGSALGVGIFIEVKRITNDYKDRHRKKQIEFMEEVQAAGGIYFLANDYEHYLNWYETVLKPQYL